MRSSTIAAGVTAGLMLILGALKLPALLLDQRSSNAIWHADIEPGLERDVQPRLMRACRSKFAEPSCTAHVGPALSRIRSAVRAGFDRCMAGAWAKGRCIAAARATIEAADATAMLAVIDAEAARQRAEAERQRAAVEAQHQAKLEDERRQAVVVMGSDDGRAYLLAAYNQSIASAERECREHGGLTRIMQWHEDANPEDFRVERRVREACHAIMRKQPFVIRPDGRETMIGYPIPPFEQIDYWGRSRCSERGREAWRCIMQSAEAVRDRRPYWGELDHESNAILRSLNIRQPGLNSGVRPQHPGFGRP